MNKLIKLITRNDKVGMEKKVDDLNVSVETACKQMDDDIDVM